MLYRNIPYASALQRMIASSRQTKASAPYMVDCIGLDRTTLSLPGAFETAYRERDEWCREHCPGNYLIEPLGPCPERLTGRRFWFVREADAALFKMVFQ